MRDERPWKWDEREKKMKNTKPFCVFINAFSLTDIPETPFLSSLFVAHYHEPFFSCWKKNEVLEEKEKDVYDETRRYVI